MSETDRQNGRKGYEALLARYGTDGVRKQQARGGYTTTARHGDKHEQWGRKGGQARMRKRAAQQRQKGIEHGTSSE